MRNAVIIASVAVVLLTVGLVVYASYLIPISDVPDVTTQPVQTSQDIEPQDSAPALPTVDDQPALDVPDVTTQPVQTSQDIEPQDSAPALFTVNALSITNATIPTDVTHRNNQFALDFYRQVSSDANIFFSSISMYVAFSILYEGALGNTAAEIRQVFGLEPDDTARHNLMAQTISTLNRKDSHATLNVANALWIADLFEPSESYLDIARKTYLASSQTVDFTDPNDSVKRINQWASDNTNEKITEVLDGNAVGGDTIMVINNAIYFKGTWVTQFAEEDTLESDFWTDGEDSVRADFMHVEGTFDYARSDGAHVLRLPYEGDRLSMLVILPEDQNGITSLEESISTDMLERWQDGLSPETVIVKMPKFTAKINYDLKPLLRNMGMIDAFDEFNANLWGLVSGGIGRNMFVSDAFHDSFIDVNEEGTEAAAVTTIIIAIESAEPIQYFTADHPFIFIIQDDESGSILFMGKISDPTCMDKEC